MDQFIGNIKTGLNALGLYLWELDVNEEKFIDAFVYNVMIFMLFGTTFFLFAIPFWLVSISPICSISWYVFLAIVMKVINDLLELE